MIICQWKIFFFSATCCACKSDEDSANEVEGGLLDNLTGRQLLSEIILPNQRCIGSFDYDEKEGIDDQDED